jgi:hypothetical protein
MFDATKRGRSGAVPSTPSYWLNGFTKNHRSEIQSSYLVCFLAELATLLIEIQCLFFLHGSPHSTWKVLDWYYVLISVERERGSQSF